MIQTEMRQASGREERRPKITTRLSNSRRQLWSNINGRERSHRPETVQGNEWWRNSVIYQIYPRSFNDSNGDGNGDLKGVIKKLKYLHYLGIDGIWLNPIFPSPMKDGGYDIADYRTVDPMFGTNKDIQQLIKKTDKKGIKVIMDLVVNHTSDQHQWFQEALHDPNSKYRNYYVWKDPKPDGSPPNNWASFFDKTPGSAWTLDENSGKYYLHKFHPSQPDLNPYNPHVWDEVEDITRYWLDQGVSGIRFDVLSHLYHDPTFADAEPNPDWKDGDDEMDRYLWQERYLLPDVFPLTSKISNILHEYGALGIGEIYSDDDKVFERIRKFYEAGLDMPFNFAHLVATQKRAANAAEFKRVQDLYASCVPEGAEPTIALGNHDQNLRLADRVGAENLRAVIMMQLTLGGTAFIYQGDEIGMKNGNVITSDNQRDPQGIALGLDKSRDHSRTGFVWNSRRRNGGFSKNKHPYLPGGVTIDGRGALEQIGDPKSLLEFTRDLINLRREQPALHDRIPALPLESGDPDVLAFKRNSAKQQIICAFNFSGDEKKLSLQDGGSARLIRSTNGRPPREHITGATTLAPHEGVIFELLGNLN